MDSVIGNEKPNVSKLRQKLDSWLAALDVKTGVQQFSLGLPVSLFRSTTISQNRVFWIPAGLPNGRSIHIASSRLGRHPESKPAWFDAMRTICIQLRRGRQFLISADGTASHLYVERAAQLFQIPFVDFRPLPKQPTTKWIEETQREIAKSNPLEKAIYFSEPLEPTVRADVDSLLISAAYDLRLLSVRKGGNVLRSTMNRLSADSTEASKPWLLVEASLTPEPVQEELIAAGACAWWLYDKNAAATQFEDRSLSDPKIVPVQSIKLSDFLLHWTRRNHGPWPGETGSKYFDDLILNAPAANHDRLSALCRIIATRRLLASNYLTRDHAPVVCFSAVKVDQLPAMRTFRSHVGRWDFETVGIAIRRTLLKKLGARPVIYGDESTWTSLSETDRPFFQIRKSISKCGTIDWTREEEWRVVGDVDLSLLKPDDAFLFVSSESEAQAIARLSRWPIVNLHV